jgi:hypothetical protein
MSYTYANPTAHRGRIAMSVQCQERTFDWGIEPFARIAQSFNQMATGSALSYRIRYGKLTSE